jgi:hypothetical protein
MLGLLQFDFVSNVLGKNGSHLRLLVVRVVLVEVLFHLPTQAYAREEKARLLTGTATLPFLLLYYSFIHSLSFG